MTGKKNEAGSLLPMTVIEGITVNVLPNEQYEFLLSTADVGIGYGVTYYAIQQAKHRHEDELKEGKHFVTALTVCQGGGKMPHNKMFWTKAGIVRLGFFIKSERAKLFRDWAENLIIKLREHGNLFEGAMTNHVKALTVKRRHNRLTPERLLDVMADVCRIGDSELRISIANKLMGGVL